MRTLDIPQFGGFNKKLGFYLEVFSVSVIILLLVMVW